MDFPCSQTIAKPFQNYLTPIKCRGFFLNGKTNDKHSQRADKSLQNIIRLHLWKGKPHYPPKVYKLPLSYTRSVQKVLQMLNFSTRVYLFMNIYIALFKVIPLGYRTFMPTFFQSSIDPKESFFCSPSMPSLSVDFANRKELQGTRSGQYGGPGTITVLFFAET